jgi:ribonuclease HII
MTIAREEIFGPVLSIMPFDGEEEAVEIANDTPYGLTNYVQSQDGGRRNRLARRLRSGMVEMNGQSRGAGSPFGGVKASGRAREGGRWGIEEFLDVKSISGWAARVRVAAASSSTIDRIGIRNATLDAMRRAIAGLASDLPAADLPVFVDGLDVPPGLASRCEAVVRGDSSVPQIAASSIVAKTCRDRLMRMLALRHPNYRWEKNAGYGTADHLDALARYGPTRHHRQSFRPVSQLSLGLEALVDAVLEDVG